VELALAKAALHSRGNYRNTSPDTEELTRLRAKEAAQAAELNAMERQVRDGASSVAKVTAEVEKERGERRRVEERFAALSGQLQDLHKELKRHLDAERAGQGRVSELEQKLRNWKDPKAT
jgi:chromosome segregation ATPase